MAVVPRGKPALTNYRTLTSGRGWALLECRLETGRTHQIRVHMHSIGYPLIGDPVYSSAHATRALPARARAFPRQALHARRLALRHPVTEAVLQFESPLPADLLELQSELEQHAPAR
jgi:23S rRNA pseudouridine1911/1915/1917 synthase